MADRSLGRHTEKDQAQPSGFRSPARSTATAGQDHPILHLQRTVGSQAVLRLLQTSLEINEPGDESEQEAERIADRVTATPPGAAASGEALSPIRRCAASSGICKNAAPASVDQTLATPGTPLE